MGPVYGSKWGFVPAVSMCLAGAACGPAQGLYGGCVCVAWVYELVPVFPKPPRGPPPGAAGPTRTSSRLGGGRGGTSVWLLGF